MKSNIIRIPLELKSNFLRDPENFMRDIACISTESIRPFFKLKDKIIEVENSAHQNPFNDKFRTFEEDFKAAEGDIYNRYMHIDLAIKKDAVGISMCHAPYFEDREMGQIYSGGVKQEIVKEPFIFFDFIGRIKVGHGEEVLLSDIREIIYEIGRRGFYIALITFDGFQCLRGDTKVKLLDGSYVTMEKLSKYKEPFWVYSWDHKRNKIVPGLAKHCRKTGIKAPVYRVILDNKEEVVGTQDHPFLLRDGSYKLLKDLKPGDSLMPLYYKLKALNGRQEKKGKFYEQIFQVNAKTKKWKFIHREVIKSLNILISKEDLIHHININKLDNRPENLQVMDKAEHRQIHKDLIQAANEIRWTKEAREIQSRKITKINLKRRIINSNRHKDLWKNKEWRKDTVASISDAVYNKWKDEEYRIKMEARPGVKWTEERKAKSKLMWFMRRISKKVEIAQRLNNHKIVSIEPCGYSDVYDLEVPNYNNFGLASGIFVHNSVDSIQILRDQGYKVGRLSIDRTATKLILDKKAEDGLIRRSTEGQVLGPMQALKDVLYDDRLQIAYHKYWEIEAKAAEIDYKKNKVDHPSKGSIDVLQSIAGSIYNLINNEFEFNEVDETAGSMGDDFYEKTEGIEDNFYDNLDNEDLYGSKRKEIEGWDRSGIG